MLPKLSPVTVTDAPPLCGAFSSPYDATGASKVNPTCCVPDIAPTVRELTDSSIVSAVVLQRTALEDVHMDVMQRPAENSDVAVKS
jgi:hypothetical protein